MSRAVLLGFAALVTLAGCGAANPGASGAGTAVELTGTVSAFRPEESLIVLNENGHDREVHLLEDTTVIDTSGAQRTLAGLPHARVQIHGERSATGRYTAQRITVLPKADAGGPTVIEPPAQD